jgi:hypothetical protein
MDEHVLAAAFRRDEAKALGGVEKFHGTDRHLAVPALSTGRRMPDGRDFTVSQLKEVHVVQARTV